MMMKKKTTKKTETTFLTRKLLHLAVKYSLIPNTIQPLIKKQPQPLILTIFPLSKSIGDIHFCFALLLTTLILCLGSFQVSNYFLTAQLRRGAMELISSEQCLLYFYNITNDLFFQIYKSHHQLFLFLFSGWNWANQWWLVKLTSWVVMLFFNSSNNHL